jgi:hypothetical protein
MRQPLALPLLGVVSLATPVLAAPTLGGCPPVREGDDDVTEAFDFGGLDLDGDGLLTGEDLEAPGLALFAEHDIDGTHTEARVAANAWLYWWGGSSASIEATFDGDVDWYFNLQFAMGPPSPGTFALLSASVSPTPSTWYASGTYSDGTITLDSEDNFYFSGGLDTPFGIPVTDSLGNTTGEVITVRGLAARDVQLQEAIIGR